MISQSIGWWCFVPQKLTPEQFVRSAAEAGFVALDLVPSEYWQMVTDHGLAISSIGGHHPLEIGLNRIDQHDRIEQEVRSAIADAQRLKIPNVICFSGNREGLDDAKGIEITAAGLRKLAPFAEEAGVTLVLELLNSSGEVALRHLPYADHGRRRDPHDPSCSSAHRFLSHRR